jgi:hypothetical protein
MTSRSIGTLREKPLHAALKQWCAAPGDRCEVAVDGFVVDVVRDDLLIEIQTTGFSAVKGKLHRLLDSGHRVRVVHPIAVTRTIVRLGSDGAVLGRRKSPRRGSPLGIFAELVSFPELVAHPRFDLEIVLTTEDEYRRHDPTRAWRRKGWVVAERRLAGIVDVLRIAVPDDLVALLPAGLPARFDTADLTAAAGCTRRLAQQTAYCLRKLDLIEPVGKRGNAIEYRWA